MMVSFPSFVKDSDQPNASEKQYWAKGTGFGTGSTSSGWDMEHALMKQRSEEQHVTYLLQVSTTMCLCIVLHWFTVNAAFFKRAVLSHSQ